jgi:signal transduction histidine kinase
MNMAIPLKMKGLPTYLLTSRTVQVGWLLFALPALSLALTGIAPFHQLLQTSCAGPACLIGQLPPAEVSLALAFGNTLPEYADLAYLVYLPTYTLLFLMAATLIWRKPTHGATVCAAFWLTALATGNLAQAAAHTFPALLLPAQFIHFIQLAALLPAFCLIPNGRFHPPWFRWLALAAALAAVLVAFGFVTPPTSSVMGLLLGAFIVGNVIYRYHSLPTSPPQEQVAWMLAAATLLAGAQWLGRPLRPLPLPAMTWEGVPHTAFGFFSVFGTLLIVGALTCLAVALLNDELFRVEVVLNRALVYTLLTLFVVGGYVLVVGYLSLIFQSTDSLWFSLVATGLVAVLFQPLRQRIQRFVNKLLYGERDDPYHVIAHLGHRLENAFEPNAIPTIIAQTVRESLRLPYAAIALNLPNAPADEPGLLAASGLSTGEPISFPLTYQGTAVGYLLVSPRRGDTTLTPADRALLADLAQQAGIAIHSVRLMADLQRLTHDLQHSRERLVLAREEERRRLRRDLHDDLAPTLVGLSLQATTISDLIVTNPAKAGQLADHLDSAIRAAVGNIRRLVYDLRPPALDDLGLLAAIRERALEYSSGRQLRVEVDAPDRLSPLPAAVEVAAYRIIQEGLLNVVKHAQAQRCSIYITQGEALTIEIADDGVGLLETRVDGVGLRSIQERAAELGGTCQLSSGREKGTRILVSLPLTVGSGP